MNIISMATEWTDQFETLQEKLFLGTSIALVGFLIVFILLTAIIFLISIMSGVLTFTGKKNNRKKQADKNLPMQSKKIIDSESYLTTTDDSEELIAVITAAICAYMKSDKVKSKAPSPGFRVRNIRRL